MAFIREHIRLEHVHYKVIHELCWKACLHTTFPSIFTNIFIKYVHNFLAHFQFIYNLCGLAKYYSMLNIELFVNLSTFLRS